MTHQILLVVIISLVTFFTRVLPFLLFPEGKEPPRFISYLSQVLPAAVMGMLVVYCLKDVTPLAYPYGLPEVFAVLLVVLSYLWKRNTLFSILLGTVSYMLFVQVVFV
jgi:branched-subunit amino acid transport protein AzlD